MYTNTASVHLYLKNRPIIYRDVIFESAPAKFLYHRAREAVFANNIVSKIV